MTIRQFENLDEMFKAMEENEKSADAAVVPWQAAIAPGDFFVKLDVVPIYGEVLDPGVRQPGSKLTDEELADNARNYSRPDMNNYRFTRSYSVACPDGELGDQHVSTIDAVISGELFDKFKANGWPDHEALIKFLEELGGKALFVR